MEELEPEPAREVGRPRTPLRLRADAFHIVAIDLSNPECVVGAVVDLRGKVVRRQSWVLGEDAEPVAVAGLVQSLVEGASRPVLGVGISAPGVIDAAGTFARATTYPGWTGVAMQALLLREIGLPVAVANDANSAALAEFTFGGAPSDGLTVITIGRGVGAGLILGGVLVQGDGAAGEIGHVTAVDEGEPCECGRRGCLETVVNAPLLRALVQRCDGQERSEALRSIGVQLARVLAPLAGALALREIRVSAPVDLPLEEILRAMEQDIRGRVLSVGEPALRVTATSFGSDSQVLGGAALVLSSELGIA